MKHVLAAAEAIGRHMTGYKVIVDKSTVPVGTADRVKATVRAALERRGLALEFAVVSNPEFLKEGAAVEDFMRPDRIIIGCDDERASLLMRAVYSPFMRQHDRLLEMDVRSAEFTKYAANAMLATRISFMNDIANLCERVGADVDDVRKGIGSDARIGAAFLFPGPGYGGSCFPKDVKAMIHFASEKRYEFRILRAVEDVNATQKTRLAAKMRKHFGTLDGKTIAVWGLAFKPRTDDMREAPSIPLIHALLADGAAVQAYDPEATKVAKSIFGNKVTFAAKNYDALKGADCLAIVTEWSEFRRPDFEKMRKLMRSPVIFDGRNLFTPDQMKQSGFTYYSIGRH
jgi:UDPglucose 6-dehydrogenase